MAKISFANIKEYFELLWINLVTQKRNFVEFLKIAGNYYSNTEFRKVDLSLLLSYFLNSPFAISKHYLKVKGEKDLYAYGETPLTTLDQISRECRLSSLDTVFELGCGRGRTCFWLRIFLKCKVVGIEYIPEFIKRADAVRTKYGIKEIDFRCEDFYKADYSGATAIYLYGTSLEDDSIKKLIDKFARLPAGTKIITVSYPLSDYTQKPLFEVMKRFQARYTWGTADVYLQIKK